MPSPGNIVLGISGSIAAYKSAFLTRLLVKSGAEVQVLMSESARDFITPLTLSTLSKRPVFSNVSSEEGWNNHVELGLWADAYLIAPATANTLAKMAAGICDSMLTAVYLSARCPVFVAPAMDLDMWKHPATLANIKTLEEHGVQVIPVGHGELASGLHGDGRMAEPEDIVAFLEKQLQGTKPLTGKRALITAGPTHEPIDPVRFIGNHSTGKMGIALAEELTRQGATVDLVLGPTHHRPSNKDVRVHAVTTAEQMFNTCEGIYPEADIAIMAAAVADYRPSQIADKKIKKTEEDMSIPLSRTIDIASRLGKQKKPGQINIGFALETNSEKENALGKLKKKNFDFIVLNSLRDPGAGFGHDTNKITIFRADGTHTAFELKEKTAVAVDIVAEIAALANPNG